MDKTCNKLMEIIDNELEEIARQGQFSSRADAEAVDHLLHAKKSMLTIDAMQGGGSSGRSYGNSYGNSYGGDYSGGSYGEDMGTSGARSRNAMGQFSRNGSRSYAGSGREEMIAQLDNMMRSASNSQDREAIEQCMRQLNR